ncbi:MAG: inositol monophosphatase family protein [Acidobacteriota bacterium]
MIGRSKPGEATKEPTAFIKKPVRSSDDSATPELSSLRDFAVDLAWNAGQISLQYFETTIEAKTKEDGTPVTIADRKTEEYLRRELIAAFPDDGLIGEELGHIPGSSGRVWVIDPIDGTESFMRGVPLFGLLMALTVAGDPLLGIMHFPALGETFSAYRGGGCSRNGQRVEVSKTSDLAEAVVTTTAIPTQSSPGTPIEPLLASVRLGRTWGDCYGYSMVAGGRADVMVDPFIKAWDIAAALPVIEEAGGRLTDLAGRRTIWSGHAVATNGLLHDAVLDRLRSGGSPHR